MMTEEQQRPKAKAEPKAMNPELRAFLNIVGAVVLGIVLIVTIWLGAAYLYGTSKVIIARFAAEAARIEAQP